MNEPRQMFLDTLTDFWGELSKKSFWEKPLDQQEILVEALTQDYFRTDHEGHESDDSLGLEMALNEYHLRGLYFALR